MVAYLWHTYGILPRAVRPLSRSSLCRIVGKPPLGQIMAWSVEKAVPQLHLVGVFGNFQPYRKQIASLNAPLWREKLWSSSGRTDSHEEAPLFAIRSRKGSWCIEWQKIPRVTHGKELCKPSLELLMGLNYAKLPMGNSWD